MIILETAARTLLIVWITLMKREIDQVKIGRERVKLQKPNREMNLLSSFNLLLPFFPLSVSTSRASRMLSEVRNDAAASERRTTLILHSSRSPTTSLARSSPISKSILSDSHSVGGLLRRSKRTRKRKHWRIRCCFHSIGTDNSRKRYWRGSLLRLR